MSDQGAEDDGPSCETCDEPVVTSADHRVVTWVEDDAIVHRHFCDEDCLAEWDD